MADKELDFDNMTPDEIEAVLRDIDAGKYSEPRGSEYAENDVEDDEDEDEVDDANNNVEDDEDENGFTDEDVQAALNGELKVNSDSKEDTEGEDPEGDDEGTNDKGDGSGQDNSTATEGEGSENTPVGQDNEGQGANEKDSATEGDGASSQTTIDAAEFDRYKKFYEQVANAEFVANGKKVKGFSDPAKIIQSQQMAYGFSEKMASFKQYRPYMQALKENGMLEDSAKFNFAMDLLKGDKEALKQHLKSLEVDPLDLDMESITYTGQNHIASNEALVLEDTLEQARNFGVEDKLRNVIGKQWDAESFNEFLTVPEVRKDLLSHMVNGQFDLVQDRIAEMKVLDSTGTFGALKATDQYRQAVQSLTADAKRIEAENARYNNVQGSAQQAVTQAEGQQTSARPTANQEAELAAKQKAQQEAEYQRKLAEKNRQAEEARKRAASVSKKKVGSSKKEEFDPLKLEGNDFDAFVDGLIRGRA